MFESCTSLVSVTLPDNITRIGNRAFYRCRSLTHFTIGHDVREIGYGAFEGCTGPASVTLPAGVTSIGNSAFSDCPGLMEITVDPNNSMYSSLDGVLLDKNQVTLVQYPAGRSGRYTIPSSVTSVGYASFSGSIDLTQVTIPDSVITIEGYAFWNCSSLSSATVGDGVTDIEPYAFADCASLVDLYFMGNEPDTDTYQGALVFYNTPNVTCYYLPGTTGWGAMFENRPTAVWNTTPGFDQWLAGHGLDPVAADLDSDGDSYDNRYEYVFGGNPTNAVDEAINPTSSIDGDTLEYRFKMRNDDPSLKYIVQACSDLVAGNWEEVATVIETNGTVDAYDSVSHRISTTNHPAAYLRLQVESLNN